MHMKAIVDTIITRTAANLAYPRGQHLCSTCGRYIRRFCAVGIEMTDGDYYQDIVGDALTREWRDNNTVPVVSVAIVSCRRYLKERR